MTNMRRGFTMIELIFVIVIIGILAAVAIPKLSQNRDDATAAICASEVGNIISGVVTRYAKDGNANFVALVKIEDVFNGLTSAGAGESGVSEAGSSLVSGGITYNCEGGNAVSFTFAVDPVDASIYNMTLDTSTPGIQPAAIKAARLIEYNQKLDSITKKKDFPL